MESPCRLAPLPRLRQRVAFALFAAFGIFSIFNVFNIFNIFGIFACMARSGSGVFLAGFGRSDCPRLVYLRTRDCWQPVA